MVTEMPDIHTLVQQAFFQDDSFEQTWMEIKQQYDILGFRDDISDQEMISEFKYIAQQLRKYKFTKQDQIIRHDTYIDMANEIESLIGKAAEYGDDRKEIVYNFMRDHWLIGMYNTLMRAADMEDEEDEDA